jgi:glycosyltransferase involved in cell wall biosynthesis
MELLDSAEMFVLPSRVEVMPRALLEAMARALPVLATAVGAVPEVVPAACLSMPGNAEQLSEMLMRITEKPALLDAMSSMNLKIASHKTEDFVIPALQSFHRDCLAHFHQTPAASQLQPSAA